ncbi:MAG: tetratricopeptide repeat protein [Longimicrobiales bacterium]
MTRTLFDEMQAPVRPRWQRAALVSALVLAGVWLSWWNGLIPGRTLLSASGNDTRPKIAVLPIESASARSEDRAFAAAMHAQLIEELNSIASIVVMDGRAMNEYRGSTKTRAQVASELDATYVIDAELAAAGGRVRINAGLYDHTGNHLWSDPFEGELREVFSLQADLARAITRRIEAVLTPAEGVRLSDRAPVDARAFNAYALGRLHFEMGGPFRAVSFDSAQKLLVSAAERLTRAVQIDSTFALGWAYLARALHWRASGMVKPNLADSLYALAEQAGQRALRSDAQEAVAWAALGFVYERTWRFREAGDAYQSMLRANPNADTWGLAIHYRDIGRLEDAANAFREARIRDPNSLLLQQQYGLMLSCVNRYEEALPLVEPDVVAPLGFPARSLRARVFLKQGRYVEAVHDFEAQLRPRDLPPPYMSYAYARIGQPAKARAAVRAREAAGERSFIDDLAIGDTSALLSRLETMIATRNQGLLNLRCSEALPDLLAIPEARAILKTMDLPRNPARAP